MRRTLRGLLLGLAGTVVVVAAQAARAQTPPQREVVVFAAASLREAFTVLQATFEKENPGVKVRFNFAGSQELRTQLEQGAAADVFVSADRRHMDGVKAAGLVDADRILVTNTPVVIVPKANPAGVKVFADLPRAKRLVIGAPEVPIGAYTLQILDKAVAKLGADFRKQVEAHVVSRELNVKQVLTKVALGEADAGVVYRTDARSAADKVDVLAIPAEFNVVAVYPVAVVKKAPQPALAQAWVKLLLSPEGQGVLTGIGFGPATASADRP